MLESIGEDEASLRARAAALGTTSSAAAMFEAGLGKRPLDGQETVVEVETVECCTEPFALANAGKAGIRHNRRSRRLPSARAQNTAD